MLLGQQITSVNFILPEMRESFTWFCNLRLSWFLLGACLCLLDAQGLLAQQSEYSEYSRSKPKYLRGQNPIFEYREDVLHRALQETLEDSLIASSRDENNIPFIVSGSNQDVLSYGKSLESINQVYGVRLKPKPGRSLNDGKRFFLRGNYQLASEIIIENRYTDQALIDPYYLNWLLKSLLASRQLELIPQYLKQYRLQPERLRNSTDKPDAELYYLIGRYHFAKGNMSLARDIFSDYLQRFHIGEHVPNSYYWIARTLERENYLEEARTVYLLVVSYYSQHHLHNLAKYKASVITLYLLKQQAENFLRSRGVDWM